MTTQPGRIGFIGLGMMGAPMVQCLANAGFELFVNDADATRTAAVVGQSGAQCLTADNAGSLDVLITMLPNSSIVERVLLGDGANGWVSRLAGGAVVNSQQCESALTSAVFACERYYQAFQFVIWAGKSSREALETTMMETQGEA